MSIPKTRSYAQEILAAKIPQRNGVGVTRNRQIVRRQGLEQPGEGKDGDYRSDPRTNEIGLSGLVGVYGKPSVSGPVGNAIGRTRKVLPSARQTRRAAKEAGFDRCREVAMALEHAAAGADEEKGYQQGYSGASQGRSFSL